MSENNDNQEVTVTPSHAVPYERPLVITLDGFSSGYKNEVAPLVVDDKHVEARTLLVKASSQVDIESAASLASVDGVVPHPFPMDAMVDLNNKSVIRRACIDAIATNMVRLGYKIKKTDPGAEQKDTDKVSEQIIDVLEKWASADDATFCHLLARVIFDRESCGNGYIEVSRNREGVISGLHYVPAHTIYIKRDRSGFIQKVGVKKVPFYNFGDQWKILPDGTHELRKDRRSDIKELIHLKLPASGSKFYGEPRDVAAIPTYFGDELARRLNTKFFTHGATPEIMLVFSFDPSLLKSAIGNQAVKMTMPPKIKQELTDHFRRTLTSNTLTPGIFHLPAGVTMKVERLSSDQREAGWGEYRKANKAEVQTAFRTPSTIIVGESSNYAAAMAEKGVYLEQVIQPEQTELQDTLMNKLWPELTMIKRGDPEVILAEDGDHSRPKQLPIAPEGGTGVNKHIWKLAFTRMTTMDMVSLAQIDNIYGTLGAKTINEMRSDSLQMKPLVDGDKVPTPKPGAEGNALAQNADLKQVAAGNPDLDNFVSTPFQQKHPEDIRGLQGRPGGGRGPNGSTSLPMPRRVFDASLPVGSDFQKADRPDELTALRYELKKAYEVIEQMATEDESGQETSE